MELKFNPRKQGDIGVAAAIFYYTQQGYIVSTPLTEASRYDLIVDTGEKILRVQCKTSSFSATNGRSYEVRLATSGGNQSWNKIVKTISKDECDLVFIWCIDGTMWEVPVEAIDGNYSFTACWKNRQYLVCGEVQPSTITSIIPQKKTCLDCPKEIDGRATRCKQHAGLVSQKTKVAWLPDKELVEVIRATNYSQVAQTLGVSDNAIRKRLTNRGYDPKTLTKLAD